jgi:hypothetical protein
MGSETSIEISYKHRTLEASDNTKRSIEYSELPITINLYTSTQKKRKKPAGS